MLEADYQSSTRTVITNKVVSVMLIIISYNIHRFKCKLLLNYIIWKDNIIKGSNDVPIIKLYSNKGFLRYRRSYTQ